MYIYMYIYIYIYIYITQFIVFSSKNFFNVEILIANSMSMLQFNVF